MPTIEPIVFRLSRGADLKQSIMHVVKEHHIQAGCVVSLVGCLSSLTIRLADGTSTLQKSEAFEIISVTGTLTPEHVHLHLSVADNKGQILGGHMMEGCIVSHTAEVCLLRFDGYTFSRKPDADTGYTELVVKKP